MPLMLDKRLLGKFLIALGATVSRASEVAGLYCKAKPKMADRSKHEFYEFAQEFFKENAPWSHMAEALRLELTYGDIQDSGVEEGKAVLVRE